MRTDSALFAQKNVELAKDPRYVIVLSFDTANTVLWAFTSHSDAGLPPGLTGSILGILEGLSGTSQTLNPDTANASIGSIDFSLVDRLSIVTTTLGAQLQLGRSTRKQRVQVYVGFQGLAWADYTLVQTQLVTEIAFSEGAYKFTCADIQREMRKDLFVQAKTTLTLSLLAADTTINVVTTTGFNMVAHGTSYSDAPSATVGYVRIQDEIIRYTGTTATSFTGCVRGALNTRAVDHLIDSTAAQDRQTAVAEYVYLELPAIDLIYRLLTGKDRLGNAVMPTTWNLGIATNYVRLTDFTGIGKDLLDTSDDQQGFVVRFEDLEKTDGKKFIETELALLCGVFMPIYANGSVGCKRMANILAGAAYTGMLDETNVVNFGDLTHDFNSLHNVIQISWNWEPLQKDFTRVNVLVDATSIAVHGRSDPYNLKFRGLHGSRHSSVILAQRFDFLRDRFTGPPQRLEVSAVPSLNTAEVGDVKRVRLQNVRDFVAPGGGGPLDRSFEIQNIQVDWITGALKKKLFASSAAPGALAPTSDATVLTTGFYTGTGTALSSVVTITGSNPGHVTVGGSLAGNVDMNAAGAIYYYDGDLQIDAGVEITIANNVQLRVKGFLQNNGKINGKGKGLAGGAQVSTPTSDFDVNHGIAGFIGVTEAGGGSRFFVPRPQDQGFTLLVSRGDMVVGANPAFPPLQLVWDGAVLKGIPSDLRGSSGSSGGIAFYGNQNGNPFGGANRFKGGAGGTGGTGLAIVCRGFAQGVAGLIDLSGLDGSVGETATFLRDFVIGSGQLETVHAGSGAGGASGGLLILLDGAGATATGLTDSGFVATYGRTPISGQIMTAQSLSFNFNSFPSQQDFYPYYVGTGDGTQLDSRGNPIPIPNMSDARGGSRVQYVPGLMSPVADLPPSDALVLFEEMQISNLALQSNPKNFALRAVASDGDGTIVAVGDADGTDAYIVRSLDAGRTWTEVANPKNVQLNSIAYSPALGMFVAVGNADGGDAYILTSINGGVSFTERANPKNFNLFGICWGSDTGLFVAVGAADGTDAYLVTSSDGTTWTERANPKNFKLLGVAYAPKRGRFLAVGESDGVDAYMIGANKTGMVWTEIANPKAIPLNSVTWGQHAFVAVGQIEVSFDSYIVRSSDGTSVTESPNPGTLDLNAVASSGVLIVARGSYEQLSSKDYGRTWRVYDLDDSGGANTWGMCWDGRRYVAVGAALGSKALIVTSLGR